MDPHRPPVPAHRRDRLEFLPALLEIEETPPSPAGRLLTWLIVLLFGVALAWACAGEVDIVAQAPGRLVARGGDKLIQPLERGVVRRLLVADGQRVRRGELLIELDDTAPRAEIAQLLHRRRRQEAVLARTGALLARAAGGEEPAAADALAAGDQHALYLAQWDEYSDRLRGLDGELARERAVLERIGEEIRKGEAILPLLAEQSDSYKALSEKNYGSRIQWLQQERARLEQGYELKIQHRRAREQRARLAQLTEQRAAFRSGFRRELLRERAEAQRQLHAIEQELVKARRRLAHTRLRAPVDGTVQQLAIHTVGGVVTPAQRLMVIVPADHRLEAEALVLNRDAGFVREGMAAEVKLEAFPFTRYGTLPARIEHLSDDAVRDDRLGLVYEARVAIDRETLLVDGREVRLAPGMALTVEIKTGRRRLIEFLLAPLVQHLDESMRER